MRTFPNKIRTARIIHARMEAEHAEFLAECEADRRNGYRSHYCEHGVNMWTEYDNICGACENGDSGSLYRMECALAQATLYHRELHELTQAFQALNRIPSVRNQAGYGDMLWESYKALASTYKLPV